MKNWIKGSLIGAALALASVAGSAQADTVTYFSSDSQFSLTPVTVNGLGYKIFDGTSIAFDISSLSFANITSFVLDLYFNNTSDSPTETWAGKITGSIASAAGTLISMPARGQVSTTPPFSTTLMPGDKGFLDAASSKIFKVSFTDINAAPAAPGTSDKFFLQTSNAANSRTDLRTRLTVNYVPAVPLPAGGVLLLTGLGGLFLARRRKV
jgi:hypothetical protein